MPMKRRPFCVMSKIRHNSPACKGGSNVVLHQFKLQGGYIPQFPHYMVLIITTPNNALLGVVIINGIQFGGRL